MHKKSSAFIKKILIIAVALVVSAVFLLKSRNSLFSLASNNTITISDSNQSVFALLYIAQEKGYFKDHGLNIEFKKSSSGKESLEKMLEGEADFAAVYETPVVLKAYDNENMRIITSLHTSSENTALLVKKSSGISSVENLSGSTIALTKGTNAEYMFDLFLQSEGIDNKKISIVDVSPENLIDAYSKDSIDGVVAWSDTLVKIEEKYPDTFLKYNNKGYTEVSMLATTQEFIDKNPEVNIKLLKALLEASNYYNENYDDSVSIVASYLQDKSKDNVEKILDHVHVDLSLNHLLLSVLDQESLWFKQKGTIDSAILNYRKFIIPEYLRDLKPEAVTLY